MDRVAGDPGPRLIPCSPRLILFGIPSVVLAAATPIAVRLAGRSLRTVGRTAGRLFSISTVGSIVGTFLTAFYLVPELGTDQLLALLAAGCWAPLVVLSALAERLRWWRPCAARRSARGRRGHAVARAGDRRAF